MQESIPVGCILSARQCTGDRDPTGQIPPPPHTQTPEDRNPPGQRPPWTEIPPEGTWDQSARQEVILYRDLPCGQTNTSEKITLPQISFVGGY